MAGMSRRVEADPIVGLRGFGYTGAMLPVRVAADRRLCTVAAHREGGLDAVESIGLEAEARDVGLLQHLGDPGPAERSALRVKRVADMVNTTEIVYSKVDRNLQSFSLQKASLSPRRKHILAITCKLRAQNLPLKNRKSNAPWGGSARSETCSQKPFTL